MAIQATIINLCLPTCRNNQPSFPTLSLTSIVPTLTQLQLSPMISDPNSIWEQQILISMLKHNRNRELTNNSELTSRCPHLLWRITPICKRLIIHTLSSSRARFLGIDLIYKFIYFSQLLKMQK